MAKLLLPLALVASCTASVLPRNPAADVVAKKNWVSLPITYRERSVPLQKRDQDVPLFNVTSISYLVECEYPIIGAEQNASRLLIAPSQ